MGKALLLLGAILTGIGLLMMFSGVFDFYKEIDTTMIKPLTDVTSDYTSTEGAVPNYNNFDHIIVHNLPYLLYGGAVICIIIGLVKMPGGEG